MKLTNNQKFILSIILAIICTCIVCVLVTNLLTDKNKKLQQTQTINTINAIVDTGRKTIDKKDSSITYNQLVIENLDLKSLMKIKDSKLIELQKTINSYDKSQEILTTALFDVNARLRAASKTIVKHDTITGKPIYESQFALGWDKINQKPWVSGSTIAGFDTTLVDLIIHNEYSLVVARDKKTKITYADIKSRNPYMDIDSIRVFNLNVPKQSKWGFGVVCGYGIIFGVDGKLYHGISVTIGFGRKL